MPPEYIGKEIMKCLDLAKDGVHALLLVLSVRNRFTAEEVAAVESLQNIFGEKVVKYMIVVFTGGDELEENDETLDEYLLQGAPEYLKVRNLYATKYLRSLLVDAGFLALESVFGLYTFFGHLSCLCVDSLMHMFRYCYLVLR